MNFLIYEVGPRIVNILFTFDCFMFSVCTLGKAYPGESFSSAAHRSKKLGGFYGNAEKYIDGLFSLLGQKDHCKVAYASAKLNIPEDMR